MNRKNGHDRKKLNNAGMTLIEVLVAMLILALVSLTFLESFSYAVKINKEARVKQHALTFAQSLMESTKAYGKKTMDEQFNASLTPEYDQFKIFPITSEVRSIDGSTYKLTGVDFNGYKYDAEITLTPSADAANTANLITVEDVNQFNDAFFLPVPNEDEPTKVEQDELFDYALDAVEAEGYTGDLDKSCISISGRTLYVTIGSDDTVTIKSTYDFSISDHPTKDLNGDGVYDPAANETYSESGSFDYDYGEIYKNTNTSSHGARLENLYLYYYPAYKTMDNGMIDCDSDSIVIDNHSSNVKNIYVLKQLNNQLGPTGVQQGESDYNVSVTHTAHTPAVVNIYDNLDEKLTGSGNPGGSISGTGFTEKGEPWKEAETPTVLLYDVTVKIKENGKSDVICELKGSANTK